MTEPRTAAGRALLLAWERDPKELWLVEEVRSAILAIEDEARAAALDEARVAVVYAVHGWSPGFVFDEGQKIAAEHEVAAAIDALREPKP